ncbi:MAG: hypothetical protein JWN83_782 [Chitinophagaceae bacterium]|nr:hypothetical protein [Chitinophagaceae bacterium]
MKTLLVIAALCCYSYQLSAQTPGIIVRPSGTSGPVVLDPNGDGYTSINTSGFGTSDITNSEIAYKLVPPLINEPTGDLLRGPSGQFSDIVRTLDGSGFYLFNDGTNLLCRIRMGGIVSGSKGYSVLIDTDQKFGPSGPDADPNYQAATTGVNGNPGFELEVVYETNFRVAVYNVDGTSSPVLLNSYLLDTHSQISVAATTDGANADYFYDFFVPFSALGISSTTPIRIVATTVMAPQAAIGGPKSDIYGVSGNNYMTEWIDVITHQPFFKLTDITGGGGGIGSTCTAPPVVNESIAPSAVNVTGTWTKSPYSLITSATITLYKNGVSIGTTTVTSGGTWSINVSGLANNDVITAKAQSAGESQCLTSNEVIVNGCTTSTHTATPVITCSSNRGFEGTMASGATLTLYKLTSAGYILFANDATTTYKISYPTLTTWRYDDVNVQSGSACTGGPSDIPTGSYMAVADVAGSCTSLPASVCISGTTAPLTPTVTSFLVDGASTINGTAAANSGVNLWVDGYFIQSVTANSGGVFTFNLTKKLQVNQQVEINCAATGSCISSSFIRSVTCYMAAPVITANTNSQVVVGAQLTGTSDAVAGTTITVYTSGNAIVGTALVQANGTWALASPVITTSTSYYAKCTGTVCGSSAASNTVSSAPQTSNARCGTITGPVSEAATSVAGTITSAVANTVVTLYVDGIAEGATTISGTAWSIPVNTTVNNTIYSGAVLSIGIAEPATVEFICGASITIGCTPPSTPLISPASTSIIAGQKVTYTVSSSQPGILYSLRNNSDTTNVGASSFGNGSSITLLSDAFNIPGTYTIKVKSISFSGANCDAGATATIAVTGTLPLSILSFAGKYNNGIARLNWTTAYEKDVKLFEIEKSYTGSNFYKAGYVNAIAGNQTNQSYSYNDSSILSRIVYYRIKMINNDLSFKYSDVIAMYTDKDISVSTVNPNPFKESVTVTINAERNMLLIISISDMMGRKVRSVSYAAHAGINLVNINALNNLSKGTYLLEINSAGERICRQTIIKN